MNHLEHSPTIQYFAHYLNQLSQIPLLLLHPPFQFAPAWKIYTIAPRWRFSRRSLTPWAFGLKVGRPRLPPIPFGTQPAHIIHVQSSGLLVFNSSVTRISKGEKR
jgi:hypothetical protein